MREDFRDGAYTVEWWRSALFETIEVASQYESIDLGLTDASLIALAAYLENDPDRNARQTPLSRRARGER